jgi:thymidylate synthase (FAD)
MKKVEPKIFLIGESSFLPEEETSVPGCHIGFQSYLNHVNANSWHTDASSDIEAIPEIYGRLCYRSWEPGLNPNVTKVRQGNKPYLDNILQSAHGSTLEHAFLNFIFADISRIFSHELVRHRTGVAISQESLRFVRLSNLSAWIPTCIQEDEKALTIFSNTFENLEKLQLELARHFNLDDPSMPFSKKKEITSAMRRIAPDGLATTIGWSANIRTIRHVIEMRTASHAEEEIRLVFDRVAQLCQSRYPNLFSDYSTREVNGINEWFTINKKV